MAVTVDVYSCGGSVYPEQSCCAAADPRGVHLSWLRLLDSSWHSQGNGEMYIHELASSIVCAPVLLRLVNM